MSTVKARTGENPLLRSAMLVRLTVHAWGNRKMESEFSDKVAGEAQAETSMLTTSKKLVPKDAITGVTSAINRFKHFHYINTSPWDDDGTRILAAANFLIYKEEERKRRADLQKAVDEFVKDYANIRERAKKKLGKTWNEADYPTPAQLKNRWHIEIRFNPMPDKKDFRVDLPAEELARVAANIDEQVKQGLENTTRDLFERLYAVVLTLRDKLKGYKVTTTGKGKTKKQSVEGGFRDSIVENIKVLCTMLPRLNVTNNPDLVKLVKDAERSLGVQDPDVLRDDDKARADTIAEADKLLKAMADYVGS